MVDRLARLLDRARPALRGEQLALHLLALGVGVAAAAGAVVFREAIDLFQLFFLGFRHENVASGAVELPAWRLLLAPTAGGLLIGYLSYRFVPGGRPQGVAHVIEANARLAGRMPSRSSTLASPRRCSGPSPRLRWRSTAKSGCSRWPC